MEPESTNWYGRSVVYCSRDTLPALLGRRWSEGSKDLYGGAVLLTLRGLHPCGCVVFSPLATPKVLLPACMASSVQQSRPGSRDVPLNIAICIDMEPKFGPVLLPLTIETPPMQLRFLKILGDVLDRISFKQAVDKARTISANSVFNSKIRRGFTAPTGPRLAPTELQEKQDHKMAPPRAKSLHGPARMLTQMGGNIEMNPIAESSEEDSLELSIEKPVRAVTCGNMAPPEDKQVHRPRSLGDLPAFDLAEQEQSDDENSPRLSFPGDASSDEEGGSPVLPLLQLISSHDDLPEGSGAMSPVIRDEDFSAASCPVSDLRGLRGSLSPPQHTSPRGQSPDNSGEPLMKQVSFRMSEDEEDDEAQPSRQLGNSRSLSPSIYRKQQGGPARLALPKSESDALLSSGSERDRARGSKSLLNKPTASTLSSGSNVPLPEGEDAPCLRSMPAVEPQEEGHGLAASLVNVFSSNNEGVAHADPPPVRAEDEASELHPRSPASLAQPTTHVKKARPVVRRGSADAAGVSATFAIPHAQPSVQFSPRLIPRPRTMQELLPTLEGREPRNVESWAEMILMVLAAAVEMEL
eukprot:s387_g15.t1